VASLTNHDTWGAPGARRAVDLAPLAPSATAALPPAAPAARSGGSGSYRVFPCESPNHCAEALVESPEYAGSSPEGWHATGTTSYTITRGNNVYAYEDRANTNTPGFSPDGGASLAFDFPLDLNLAPVDYQESAITNLFYYNNIIHDVSYQHGFDEASGNFQTNNFGNGGVGADEVQAEAQDGSGTNNANFSTPGDGARPRMQMYEWSGGVEFQIDEPQSIAGPYEAGPSEFGAGGTLTEEDVALAVNADGSAQVCDEGIANPGDLVGKVALIERGGGVTTVPNCSFYLKTLLAQEAGAIGVIVQNCLPGSLGCNATTGEEIITMALPDTVLVNEITIPSIFVANSTGAAMRANLPAPGVAVTIAVQQNRDSDHDGGVVFHEYGHGISNRTVGTNVGCLNNGEQMGEGWSDLFALLLTMRPGDAGEDPRGIATYLVFQGTDGLGIRRKQYSTNFAVNDWTYGDTRTMGVPHDIGEVWATIVWEATWELIDAHGFDPDIYDGDGTAGNQIMLSLLIEGMKLTPCSPGFVDSRNGILAADTLLYGGAHSELLWDAFARRGLGVNANQGSSGTTTDNEEDFTSVASEPGAEQPEVFSLSAVRPNPSSRQAQLTLQVAAPQHVLVELYDALGRRVAVLHDGELAAGAAHELAVDASALASGTYLVRATGASFTATERLTVLR
jgi:hypothetical protein